MTTNPARYVQETFYSWVGPNSKAPILQSAPLVTTTGSGQNTYTASLLNKQAVSPAGLAHGTKGTAMFAVSPNPATTGFSISAPKDAAGVIQVINLNGQVVVSQEFTASSKGAVALDGTAWPRGFYVVQMQTAAGVTRNKLLLQ